VDAYLFILNLDVHTLVEFSRDAGGR